MAYRAVDSEMDFSRPSLFSRVQSLHQMQSVIHQMWPRPSDTVNQRSGTVSAVVFHLSDTVIETVHVRETGNYEVVGLGLDGAGERPSVGTPVRRPLWFSTSSGAPPPARGVPSPPGPPPSWGYLPPLPSRGMPSPWPHNTYDLPPYRPALEWYLPVGTFSLSTWTGGVLCRTTLNNMVGNPISSVNTPDAIPDVSCHGYGLHHHGLDKGRTIICMDGVASAVAAGGVRCQEGAF